MHKSTAVWAFVAISGVIAGMAYANRRDSSAYFTVSTTVNAVARLERQSAPATVDVTAADIRRGYIDVEQPTSLVIRSNSAQGFALEILTVTPMLTAAVVHGLGSDQWLGAEGGTLVQRWNKPQAAVLSLKFRLVLVPGLSAGQYPWPISIAVRPLESA